jgi:hypothetical protein
VDTHPHPFRRPKFSEGTNPGPVLPNVQVYLVFWGTAWLATPHPVPYSADIIGAVASLLNSPYLSKVDQYDNRLHYGHPGHGRLAGTAFVSSAIGPSNSQSPANPPTVFQDIDVARLVSNLILTHQVPNPNDKPEALYVVIMPQGVSSNIGAAGEHFSFLIADAADPHKLAPAYIAWVTNNGTLGSTTTIFSHELVESVTDPEGNAVVGVPGTCTQAGWCEVGDVCKTTGFVNGVAVQSYWSDEDHACVVPTEFPYDSDFRVDKYKVHDAISLWLMIHGGDPAWYQKRTRELATMQLIEKLALSLSDVNTRESLRAIVQPIMERDTAVHQHNRLAANA